jgi:hypothetical protein
MTFKMTTGSMRAAGLAHQIIFRFTGKHGARRWFFDVWAEIYTRLPILNLFVRWGRQKTITTVGVCRFERTRRFG